MGRQRKSRGLAEKAATTVSPSPDCGGALPQRPAVPGAQGAWADRGLEIRENGGPVGGAKGIQTFDPLSWCRQIPSIFECLTSEETAPSGFFPLDFVANQSGTVRR